MRRIKSYEANFDNFSSRRKKSSKSSNGNIESLQTVSTNSLNKNIYIVIVCSTLLNATFLVGTLLLIQEMCADRHHETLSTKVTQEHLFYLL